MWGSPLLTVFDVNRVSGVGVSRNTGNIMTESYRGAEEETCFFQKCLGRGLEDMASKLIHDELTRRRESETNFRHRTKQLQM